MIEKKIFEIDKYLHTVDQEIDVIKGITSELRQTQIQFHSLEAPVLDKRIQDLASYADNIEHIEDTRNSLYKDLRNTLGVKEWETFSDLEQYLEKKDWQKINEQRRKLKLTVLNFRSQLNVLFLFIRECENLKSELLERFFPSEHDLQYNLGGRKNSNVHTGLLCDWST